MTEVRRRACAFCPYRRDVPPGVWHPEEYEKLRGYDAFTPEQPLAVFMCHSGPDLACHGWAVVHTSRGHSRDLLALRLRPPREIPAASTELFGSAEEAADYGQQEMDVRARAAIEKMVRAYARLREEEQ